MNTRAGTKVLLVQHLKGHWSFPKGHKEPSENDQATARRELEEETGIRHYTIDDRQVFIEDYTIALSGQRKIVKYFIAYIPEGEPVIVQEKEIQNYVWATPKEAFCLATYDNTKSMIKEFSKIL